jgi:S1-C subfamily serine protease
MEGFFYPHQLHYPFDIARVLQALVRIESHIVFVITVFDDEDDIGAMADSHDTKTYLPEGVVLWHLVWKRSLLEEARVTPGLRAHPALHAAIIAFEGVSHFPSQRIARLTCPATGFFISPQGHILTNYHVIREDIEAQHRTQGSNKTSVCQYSSFQIPVLSHGRITDWKPLDNVCLINNVKESDWQQGLDVALLKAPIASPSYLPLSKQTLEPNQPLWHFGFPFQSYRHQEALTKHGYSDADASLRVSRGNINQVMRHNFVTDADSFSGNSGSPALNALGEVTGLVWNMYPHEELERRAEVFEGGTIYVHAASALKHLGLEGFYSE